MSLKDIWDNGIDFENFDKKWLIFLAFPGIFWFFFKVSEMNPYNLNKEWFRLHVEDQFNGRIIKKWRDHRNNPYFKLSDSTIGNYEVIWNDIKIGDSIYKKKNSQKLLIIKKDTTINFDVYKEFEYYDSLMRNDKY